MIWTCLECDEETNASLIDGCLQGLYLNAPIRKRISSFSNIPGELEDGKIWMRVSMDFLFSSGRVVA